jgi:CRISPR/Cas system CSM-associated protein Csm4 (group 5 of RAMP superfamily)
MALIKYKLKDISHLTKTQLKSIHYDDAKFKNTPDKISNIGVQLESALEAMDLKILKTAMSELKKEVPEFDKKMYIREKDSKGKFIELCSHKIKTALYIIYNLENSKPVDVRKYLINTVG